MGSMEGLCCMLSRSEAIVQAIVAMDGIEAVYLRANRYSAAA